MIWHNRVMLAARGVLLLPAILLGACSHVFETFNVDADESVSIDAKQRVVLVTKLGGPRHTESVVCAEPSPDAFSATAAALAAQGGDTAVQAGVTAALKENAASIGTRTPPFSSCATRFTALAKPT
jgi:hypothetical protein